MGTAIKHPVPGRVKQSFAIFDIRALSVLRLIKKFERLHHVVWRNECQRKKTSDVAANSELHRLSVRVPGCQKLQMMA